MTSVEPVSLGEVSRRVDEVRADLRAIDLKLSAIPTRDQITETIANRDRVTEALIRNLEQSVRDLTSALDKERQERQQGDRDNEGRTDKVEGRIGASRALAISAFGVTSAFILGLVGFIVARGG